MINQKKKRLWNIGSFFLVFAVYYIYFFFYKIAPDNYVFYSFTDFSLRSFLDYFLHYGNGRILGNLICAFFSHKFELAPLFVTITMLSVFLLLNKLIFNSTYHTFLAISFLFIIADCLNVEGIYSVLPSFVNYFVPVLPYVFSVYLISVSANLKKLPKIIICIIACFSVVCSTLFSENTTIVLILFSLLLNFYCYSKNRRVNSKMLLLTCSLVAGALILVILPHIFGVAGKLDWYRGTISLNPKTMLIQAAAVAWYTTEFTPLLLVVSAAIVLYIAVESDKKINSAIYLLLVGIPLITICFFENDDFFSRLIILALMCLYAFTLIYAVFTYFKKEDRLFYVGLLFIILSNIGMCIIVNPIGIRVLFISYFFAVIWLLLTIRQIYPCVIKNIKTSSKHIVSVIMILLLSFVGFSVNQKTDSFNLQVYEAADENIRSEIDLSDEGLYINKFIFAIKHRSLVNPKNGEKIFADNGYLWSIIGYLEK